MLGRSLVFPQIACPEHVYQLDTSRLRSYVLTGFPHNVGRKRRMARRSLFRRSCGRFWSRVVGRLCGRVLWLQLVLAGAFMCVACGGGSSVTQPPPPLPDFSLNLSANSISVSQGGTSSVVNLSISPSNGFTGNVRVALSGLPAGVTSNPVSPFDVAAGASISVSFGAASNATPGSFAIFAQGSSGALSHSQT